MFVEESQSASGLTVRRSLTSFSDEYLARAKRSVSQAPLIEKVRDQNT